MINLPNEDVVKRVENRLWRHIIGLSEHDGACKCMRCFDRFWSERVVDVTTFEWAEK